MFGRSFSNTHVWTAFLHYTCLDGLSPPFKAAPSPLDDPTVSSADLLPHRSRYGRVFLVPIPLTVILRSRSFLCSPISPLYLHRYHFFERFISHHRNLTSLLFGLLSSLLAGTPCLRSLSFGEVSRPSSPPPS